MGKGNAMNNQKRKRADGQIPLWELLWAMSEIYGDNHLENLSDAEIGKLFRRALDAVFGGDGKAR